LTVGTISGQQAPTFLPEDPFFRYNQQPTLNFVANPSIILSTGLANAGTYGTYDGENVWMAQYSNNQISKIDQNGNVLKTYNVGAGIQPQQLVWDNRYIWIGSNDQFCSLVKFDPISETVLNTYQLRPVGGPGSGGIQGLAWLVFLSWVKFVS